MATNIGSPKRQITPVPVPVLPIPLPSALPQKRALEDDHAPPVSSPLNPNPDPKLSKTQSHDDIAAMARETKPARTKKETLKKRESKGGGLGADSSRATPDPKAKDLPPNESSPLRYKLAPPKPSDFEPARAPLFAHHHNVPALDGSTIEFLETSEHVYNKKNYHYLHCIADPGFPSSFYYRQTEPEPHGAHISFEDASTHMYLDQSGRHITTDKGFRMARANVAVRQGTWYWECKITRGTINTADGSKGEAHGHVRMGFARREASLDAPVGFDAYSYGIRDVEGQKVHMSRPKDFFPAGEDIKEGDVIGLEIRLPSEQLHRKVVQGQYNPAVDLLDDEEPSAEAANIVRDRIPIRFKAHIYFEKIDYHTTKELEDLMNPSPVGASGTAGSRPGDRPNPNHKEPALRTLPNSYIKVYKNGVLMGTPFTDLLAFLPPASKPQVQVGAREGMDDGMLGYYPAISLFRGGAAEVNFGPRFWCPPPGFAAADGDDVDMVDAAQDPDPDTVMVGQQSSNQAAQKLDKVRPLAERYDEQIVEDVVADIVDEVDFWMQDGARVIDRTGGRDGKAETLVGIAPGREEIKEIVQDD
ncbi:Uu.00g009130.m01.CDS01 [Anthostomella pinea]|uniref:Uu.00g009130.m01.CDS01 n=1 Tax=Anthostomella pinea TaxID=933095 RepID=A0AAI8VY00_9PEZI|nr:Uu.00g009130.m01.CDS01 [Anthostomella pinea]